MIDKHIDINDFSYYKKKLITVDSIFKTIHVPGFLDIILGILEIVILCPKNKSFWMFIALGPLSLCEFSIFILYMITLCLLGSLNYQIGCSDNITELVFELLNQRKKAMEKNLFIVLALSGINFPAFFGFTIWYISEKRKEKKKNRERDYPIYKDNKKERKKSEMELNSDFLYLQKEKGNNN